MAHAAEAEHAGGQGHGATTSIPPGNRDRVRIERTGVGETTAECGKVALVDAGRAESELHVRRGDVVDDDADAAAAAGAVVVGDRHSDEVAGGVAGGVAGVVQVLVGDAAKAEHSSSQV